MKKVLLISMLSLATFVTATLATAKIETPFDGDDTYGYPFTFFVRFSGMCNRCPPNPTEIKFTALLIDLALAITAGYSIYLLAVKIYCSLRKNVFR